MKKLLYKLKEWCRWIWHELMDWKNLLLFLGWEIIMNSPCIVGVILYFTTGNVWHLTYAGAVYAFWCAPFTPCTIICVTAALATRKTIDKIITIRQQKKTSTEVKNES